MRAQETIEFLEADLSSDAGWAEAVKGCEFVQHMASPFPAVHPKDEMELIRPARDGALRVLKAAKAAGVKRVVMTSSMAAIAYGHGEKRAEVSDETMWSNPEGPDNTPYTKSKTIAERAAWDYVNGEGKGLELATINPTGILGPALSADVSTSLEIPIRLLNGKTPGLPRIGFSFVDVRDVAECHVKAMEIPEAAGQRFLATEGFLWFTEAADILRKAIPGLRQENPEAESAGLRTETDGGVPADLPPDGHRAGPHAQGQQRQGDKSAWCDIPYRRGGACFFGEVADRPQGGVKARGLRMRRVDGLRPTH